MTTYKLCHPNCQFLFPKEIDQTNKKEPHKCLLHKVILKHGKFHPYLIACEQCKNMCNTINYTKKHGVFGKHEK